MSNNSDTASNSNLESMYQETIMDHARARHGFGLPAGSVAGPGATIAPRTSTATGAADHCGISHQLNPTCGDEITLHVDVDPATDTVTAVHWEGQGCSISMASASMLSELAPGKTVPELQGLIAEFREVMRGKGEKSLDIEKFEDAAALEGTAKFIARVKCAMLAWVAAEDALIKLA